MIFSLLLSVVKAIWLGGIVDAKNVFNESFETNNATYAGIAVN
jgi:hypothetical protein